MASKQVRLFVNDELIELGYYVHGFIDHVVSGILAALKGTGEIGTLKLSIEGDKVTIVLNNAGIPVNEFAAQIIRSTILGMVSPLKGVGEVSRLVLEIEK